MFDLLSYDETRLSWVVEPLVYPEGDERSSHHGRPAEDVDLASELEATLDRETVYECDSDRRGELRVVLTVGEVYATKGDDDGCL